MTVTEFNLLSEAWIPVHRTNGEQGLVSIVEIFDQASTIRGVGGDIPTQAFALQRILLAIVHRAIDWGDKPEKRWAQIWKDGQFPVGEIESYTQRFAHRFDLLDTVEPFFQVADLATAKGEFTSLERIIADVPSNEKYFTTRAGPSLASIPYAEAARWIVHCQAFDPSGIKSGDPRDRRVKNGKGYPIGVAWSGQLGGVLFEGTNLFQTLLLNTVLRNRAGDLAPLADAPVWERDHAGAAAREDPTPLGPTDLLTWQSRRLRLDHDGESVRGVLIMNGDAASTHNRFDMEFLTPWRFSEPQSKKFGDVRYLPQDHKSERALWRGVTALLSDVSDPKVDGRMKSLAPGVAHWLDRLVDGGYLDKKLTVRPHALGLAYINQSSIVGESIDDVLQIHLALLGRYSETRSYATTAVGAADGAIAALANLAGNLAAASGGESDGPRSVARAEAFFALDAPFRRWLAQLTDDTDLEDYLGEWHRTVKSTVEPMSRALIESAGAPAFVGRTVRERHVDSSQAAVWFRQALRKELVHAFPAMPKPDASKEGASV